MSMGARVATVLLERLGTITQKNGFTTNMGENVFWGRVSPPRHAQFVGLFEFEEDEVLTPPKLDSTVQLRVPYIIEAQAECDPEAPNAMGHDLVADIKRAVWGLDPVHLFPDGVNAVEYKGKKILPIDVGTKRVVVEVRLQITMMECLASP